MGIKGPGRTLGEEQAYQEGKVDGRRDVLVALGGAFGKVLAPDSLDSLATALLEGLAKNPPATVKSSGVDPSDPTEPANWQGRHESATVYAVAGCVFKYCPHPEQCKARVTGCTMLARINVENGAKL